MGGRLFFPPSESEALLAKYVDTNKGFESLDIPTHMEEMQSNMKIQQANMNLLDTQVLRCFAVSPKSNILNFEDGFI